MKATIQDYYSKKKLKNDTTNKDYKYFQQSLYFVSINPSPDGDIIIRLFAELIILAHKQKQ